MTEGFTVWVDVEDIFRHFVWMKRPSGIQRVVHEILGVIREEAARRGDRADFRLLRRGGAGALVAPVTFEELDALFAPPAGKPPEPARRLSLWRGGAGAPVTRDSPLQALRHALVRRFESLPPETGEPLLRAGRAQMSVLRALRRRLAVREVARTAARDSGGADSSGADSGWPGDMAPPGRGDLLLILGAAWSEPGFAARVAWMRERYGVRPVLLVHDLIPLLAPEWVERETARDFREWFDSLVPQCARVLAVSRATAAMVEDYARAERLKLPGPVGIMRMGTGFDAPKGRRERRSPGLPPPKSYVLFVSTLEPRKNHVLAFTVWLRLLETMPRRAVPTLVFAGRVGSDVTDLMRQIGNAGWLGGKLRLIVSPTDAELDDLYEGCLFTLFPSLFEGWGLPVTESLARGVPCLASGGTSLPEAGGTLARYFDPLSVDDAYVKVRALLEDRPSLEVWRAEVREKFRPVPWTCGAGDLLDACEAVHGAAVRGAAVHGEEGA